MADIICPAYTPGALDTLTVSNAVVVLTAAKYKPTDGLYSGQEAKWALITVRSQAISFTLNGTDPVGGTTGHYAAAGSSILLSGYIQIKTFKAIRDGGSDATIDATYFF